MKIDVTIRSPRLLRYREKLSGPERAQLSRLMGEAVREKTRGHLIGLAGSRHATANRLGATPSGHLAMAARAVEGAPIEADASSATVTISHVGLNRAFGDVTIVPKSAKALAIPLIQQAYNRRPRQMSEPMFVLRSKKSGKSFLAIAQGKGEPPLLAYLLVRSVTQKQDRTLLPSDGEWQAAAIEAATEFFLTTTH